MISILGVDPGMTRFGWSSVTLDNDVVSLGLCGLIENPRDSAITYNDYLDTGIAQISEQFPVILSLVQPHVIYAEFVPPGRLGSRSELVVAAATTAKTIALQWGIEWRGIAASTWKKITIEDAKATKPRIRNYLLDSFPPLADRHKREKEEQRIKGDKPLGIPQDVFDSLGIAIAGCKLYDQSHKS